MTIAAKLNKDNSFHGIIKVPSLDMGHRSLATTYTLDTSCSRSDLRHCLLVTSKQSLVTVARAKL